MKKETITIVILSLILISIAGIYSYNVVTTKYYTEGYNRASFEIQYGIVSELSEKGFLIINYPYENQTVQIKLVPEQNDD